MRKVSHQRPGRVVLPSKGARLALTVAAAANPSVSQRIHEWMVKTTAYIPPIICDEFTTEPAAPSFDVARDGPERSRRAEARSVHLSEGGPASPKLRSVHVSEGGLH